MKNSLVFVVFFVFFTLATLAVPIPMFPGNAIHTWFGIPPTQYTSYISAITNGITYSLVTWIVYVLIVKKIEKSTAERSATEEQESKA